MMCCVLLPAAADQNETCTGFMQSQEGGQNHDFSTPFAALGFDAPPQPLMRKLKWRTDEQLAEVLKALAEDGAVLLEDVIEPSVVQTLRTAYYSFLEEPSVLEVMDELAAFNKTGNFYVAERQVEGLRVRRNGAPGRFDFKPIDRRDAGPLVSRHKLPEMFEDFIVPGTQRPLRLELSCSAYADLTLFFLLLDPMRKILAECIESPTGWRVKNSGTLTTLPDAHTGAWHRDIGEGGHSGVSIHCIIRSCYSNSHQMLVTSLRHVPRPQASFTMRRSTSACPTTTLPP